MNSVIVPSTCRSSLEKDQIGDLLDAWSTSFFFDLTLYGCGYFAIVRSYWIIDQTSPCISLINESLWWILCEHSDQYLFSLILLISMS